MRKETEGKNVKSFEKASLRAKKTLYGWAQIAHMACHEAPQFISNIKGRCIVETFRRGFLF